MLEQGIFLPPNLINRSASHHKSIIPDYKHAITSLITSRHDDSFSQLQMNQDVIYFPHKQTERAQRRTASQLWRSVLPEPPCLWHRSKASPRCPSPLPPPSPPTRMFYSPPPGHGQPGVSVPPRLCNFI